MTKLEQSKGIVKVSLRYATVYRIQEIVGHPTARGFDKAINEALDILGEK